MKYLFILMLALAGCSADKVCKHRYEMPNGVKCQDMTTGNGWTYFSVCDDQKTYSTPASWKSVEVCE